MTHFIINTLAQNLLYYKCQNCLNWIKKNPLLTHSLYCADIGTTKRTKEITPSINQSKKAIHIQKSACKQTIGMFCPSGPAVGREERSRPDTDILPGVTLYLDLDRELELDDREEEREREEPGGLAFSSFSSFSSFSPSLASSVASSLALSLASSLASSSLASRSYLDRSPSSSSSSSSS